MFGGKGKGFSAFDASSPEGCVELSMMILEMAETNHNAAVRALEAMRDAAISMIVASALVSTCQDMERPLLAIESEPDPDGHRPADFAKVLLEGFEEKGDWDSTVEAFKKLHFKRTAERLEKNMPKDFTVEDILNAKKFD